MRTQNTKTMFLYLKKLFAKPPSLPLTPPARGMLNNSVAYWPDWNAGKHADRYSTTDDLYSIIRLLSTTSALIPLWCYEVKKDKEIKVRGKVQTKDLEDLPESDPVQMLLENPNPKMGSFEFFEFVYSSLFTQGEAIIVKMKPEFGTNAGRTVELWPLYPQHVVIKVSQSYPREIIAYDYVVDGITLIENLPVEDVIHIRYYNSKFSINGTELRGLSPISVLTKRLVRVDSEMSISVGQLQNGGVPTIVWDKSHNDSPDIDVMGQRKSNFYNFLSNSQGAPFFASGEMGAIATGLKLADLEVEALSKIDFKKLCNAYAVSDRLFNNDATGSEISDDNARKGLYINACLPNVYRVRDALVRGLLPDFKDKKRFIQPDISEITELQDDSKQMADWLSTAWWITPNEKREMQKFDRIEDPMFDQPLLPIGLQTLEDLAATPDLEQVTENGN